LTFYEVINRLFFKDRIGRTSTTCVSTWVNPTPW